MQENTTLASETKQPHPRAASAPQGRAAEQREKQKVPQSRSEETAPSPPPNKIIIKKPNQKKTKKKGGGKSSDRVPEAGEPRECARIRLPPGAAGWDTREQHPRRTRAHSLLPTPPSPLGQDDPSTRKEPARGAGKSQDKTRTQGPGSLLSRFPAALPMSWGDAGAPAGCGSRCPSARHCLNSLSLVIRLKANTNRSKHKKSANPPK